MPTTDVFVAEIMLGPDPSPDQLQKARLACCAAARSTEEAVGFLRMLGLI